jgi:TetR/AcrR family transcriptional repressor of nem operon
MARPRQFDEQEVRDRIADVFTAHGFRGTSLAMLTDAAGVAKQGLYNAFGDKQALYLQALDQAVARMSAAREAMAASPSGRAAIETFFSGVVQLCTHPDPVMNTCIVSAGLLEGIDEAQVNDKLCEKWAWTQELLAGAVRRGQRDGTVRSDVEADEWARLLMTLMSGLRVSARALRDESLLHKTTALALKGLWTGP